VCPGSKRLEGKLARNSEHEALIARFLTDCRATDSKLYREVCSRHAVLSDNQLRYRASKEIPISQLASASARRVLGELFYSDTGIEFGEEP
jgi:hypothetical protein